MVGCRMPAKICVTTAGKDPWNSFAIVAGFVRDGLADRYSLVTRPADADLHIHVGTPESTQQAYFDSEATRFVFYTFAEATRVPERWISWFNRADQVWVPSRFVGDVLTACGSTSPIVRVPLGVVPPAERFLGSRCSSRRFTVFWQGSRLRCYRDGIEIDGDRKRGRLVEAAFRSADIPNSRLVLKYLPEASVEYDIESADVRYICRALTVEEIAELDREADLFCWPSMGEGFGLPPLEKMSRGIPALTTAWSGMMEYLDEFKTPRIEPDEIIDVRFNQVDAKMADIRVDSLAQQLRQCYLEREELWASRPELASRAENWYLEAKMWPALRTAVEEVL
jgi:glycosyltransferase involved in cell wall biosynthesis